MIRLRVGSVLWCEDGTIFFDGEATMDYRDTFIAPPRWKASGSKRRWDRYERETATDGVNIRAAVFMVEAGSVYYLSLIHI